jgi:uncharacterized protein (DUF2252 family)
MSSLLPFDLAERQYELDTAATANYPHLLERKRQRLLLSPHSFLRGSAPLFYEILASRPDLAAGPEGHGWLVGDMHLENVGAYQTDLKGEVVFNLNDFDDTTIGPLWLDVLRLSTSVLLAGRTFQCSGVDSIALTETMMGAYLKGAWNLGPPPPMPPAIAGMIERAQRRTRKDLLDGRAPVGHDGHRHFVHGERYFALPADLAPEVPKLVAAYLTSLGERAPSHAASWAIDDAALRVAGTGSLGVTRLAVLVRDKDDEQRIVELKESRASSTEALFASPDPTWQTPAERVVLGARALVGSPPRQLTSVVADGRSFAARKLFPQEDKLRLDELRAGPKLDAVVTTIGDLLGRAHARGAKDRPEIPWSAAETSALIDHAIELAGIFESVYLAYVRRRASQATVAA